MGRGPQEEVVVVTKVVPGMLIATPNVADVAREAAARMARAVLEALAERGSATIALSGGSSPFAAYRLLAGQPIDWGKVQIYQVDERAVPLDSDRSNFSNVKKALVDPARIPAANVHRMRGDDPDLARAAADNEAELRDNVAQKVAGIPALDLVVLGIGDDGHTASLFPGEDTVNVTDRLVAVVRATEKREARLTLTAPVLENAKNTVVIAYGAAKHEPLERIWATSGDLRQTPARIIRGFRGTVTWVIDRAAGGMG
jgi:6-phosphogluconolactonase